MTKKLVDSPLSERLLTSMSVSALAMPTINPTNTPKIRKKLNQIKYFQLFLPRLKNRMKKIIKDSHEMCYYISMLSTTGGKLKVLPKKILENYNKIKRINKSKNLVIGFGITSKTITSLKKADGLVVGSQLCKGITESLKKRQNPVIKLSKMVKSLKSKIQ